MSKRIGLYINIDPELKKRLNIKCKELDIYVNDVVEILIERWVKDKEK